MDSVLTASNNFVYPWCDLKSNMYLARAKSEAPINIYII